jgi:hypothetical protein
MFKKATVEIEGITIYSQSKVIDDLNDGVPAKEKKRQTHEERELATWKCRAHRDDQGYCFIPSQAFKNCFAEAAKYMQLKIKGQGKATYTKNFEAGLIIENDLPISVHIDEISIDSHCERVFVPSDGRRGGTTRVWKYFPIFYPNEWSGTIEVLVVDPLITREVFEEVVIGAGQFIGVGRWRPRNNGKYGRFNAKVLDWLEE